MKSRALVGADADAADDELDDTLDMEKIRNVTMALEEYLQGSTIGEFDARLELVWCFYAEMDVETRACLARGAVATKRDDAARDDDRRRTRRRRILLSAGPRTREAADLANAVALPIAVHKPQFQPSKASIDYIDLES